MSETGTAPIVAGFDATGDWHDGGNGRYAKPGWSSAKALALRAVRGLFALTAVKEAHDRGERDGVWLEAADDYLSRLGIPKGHAVKVRYSDDTHALIDAVQPDGTTRAVKVKWERFADHLPAAPDEVPSFRQEITGPGNRDRMEKMLRGLYQHDLGGYRSVVTEVGHGGEFDVFGSIIDDYNGETVGKFHRVARFDTLTRAVTIENESIFLKPEFQRKGIGARFEQVTTAAAAAAGVDEVRVFAVSGSKSNGAYTWARAGFGWNPDRARTQVDDIAERIDQLDPGNALAKRLRNGDPAEPDFPTPNEVAVDPVGRRVLLGETGNVGWDGIKKLSVPPPRRVDRPTVTKNTTKADKGVGQATAARVRDAGGTGQAVVADGYLARHGHPKGSTATVTWVDDVYADVHPADEGGRTVRSKWSHFSDDAPEPERPTPVDATEPAPTRREIAAKRLAAEDPERPYLAEPPVVLHPSPALDPSRYADAEVLHWLAVPGLRLKMSDAMDLHSAKLTWQHEEGVRRGWTPDESRRAVSAIDAALDQSSDTLGWTRDRLVEAVGNVDAGRTETDLDRGVVLQRAYTDAVWQALHGDAPTIPVSRIVSPDDPARSMPGPQTGGVASWVVRGNEQQVVDWFGQRDLTPEVMRGDADRSRVLMLPEGEGRYRSDYVRVKGEVLVAGPPAKTRRQPRDMLLDPDLDKLDDADLTQVAKALFGGMTDGETITVGDKVNVNTKVSGPPHLARTERSIGAIVSLPPGADGQPRESYVTAMVVPGVDGGPHVTIDVHGWHSDLAAHVEQIADRLAADRIVAYSPATSMSERHEAVAAMRDFIEHGYTFHPNTDPYSIQSTGQQLRFDTKDNPVANAWAKWDGRDVADIPPPQALLEPENADIMSEATYWLSYKGIIDRTGRRPTPMLPRERSTVGWDEVRDLPDGTIVSFENTDDGYYFETEVGGPEATAAGVSVLYPDNRIISSTGRVPNTVTVVRYRPAPLPDPPPTPKPYPGVDIDDGVVPARPLFYPGKTVEPREIVTLPVGTRYRQVDADGNPVGFDWRVDTGGVVYPDHDPRHSQMAKFDPSVAPAGAKYVLTSVPEPPPPTTDGRLFGENRTGPVDPPDDVQVRARNALIAAARADRFDEEGVQAIAAGDINPADWTAYGAQGGGPAELTVTDAILRHRRDQWRDEHWPLDANGETTETGYEAVRLWRVPARGVTGEIMFTDTPIDGVEPEVVSARRIEGALRDDTGWVLWARDFKPTPWHDPLPSPLTDEQVAAKLADLGVAETPEGLDILGDDDGEPPSVGRVAAVLGSWGAIGSPHQHSPLSVRRVDYNYADSGPPLTVRVRMEHFADGTRPMVEWSQYSIGSPEMDLIDWDPANEIVLPVDDPRLPGVIDAVWWEVVSRTGRRATAERWLADGYLTTDIDGRVKDYEKPGIETILRPLSSMSQRLRSASIDADGNIGVVWRNDRFEVDPNGVKVPAAQATYLRTVDGVTVANLTYDGAVAARGADAVTPDYTAVRDTSLPWDQRVAHIAEQRTKLVDGLPGRTLDAVFRPPPADIHERVAPGQPVDPRDAEQFRRALAIEEHGQAVSVLVAERMAAISADRSRDLEWQNTTDPDRTIPQRHAKKLVGLLDAFAGRVGDATVDPAEHPALVDHPVFQRIRGLAETGQVEVRRSNLPDDSYMIRVSPIGGSVVDRADGDYVEFHFGWKPAYIRGDTNIEEIAVHAAGAHPYDSVRYPDTGDQSGLPKLSAATRKLAADLGLISSSDPRPTLAELAFIETLEALGIDTSTDPDISVGHSSSKTAKLGRSNSGAAYSATVGLNVYPRSWTSTIVGRPQVFEFKTKDVTTASNSGGGAAISIADLRRYPDLRGLAAHEMGHTLERTVPGLTDAEAWYLAQRVGETAEARANYSGTIPMREPNRAPQPVQRGSINGGEVWTFEDRFTRSYSGRTYNKKTISGNAAFEVFTTAVQDIIDRGNGEGIDRRLYAWIAGLLTVIYDPKEQT